MKKTLIIGAALVSFVLITILIVTGCGGGASSGSGTASATAQANTKRFLQTNIVASGTNTGTITGTITNILTGSPISGVSVEADSIRTTTNSSGNYTLNGVSAGTVSLIVSAADYDDITFVSSAAAVSIALLPINRSPKGNITGTVTDSSGNPVQGAYINAASSTYFQRSVSYTTTSSTGAYSIPSTEAGDVTIVAAVTTVEAGVYRITGSQYSKINLTANTTQEVNLRFSSNPATITGTITDPISWPELVYEGTFAMIPTTATALGIGMHKSSTPLSSYSFSVPPTQGSDQYLLLCGIQNDGMEMSREATWDWHFDYTTAAAGQTVTKNFTIGNALQITSPSHNGTISSTPTISWEAGAGNNFDFYWIQLYDSNWATTGYKSIMTKNNYYTLQSSEALPSGALIISVAGFDANGIVSFTDLDFTKIVLNKTSQNMIRVTVE